LTAENDTAKRKFEIGERLSLLREIDIGLEAGRRQPANGFVDVARDPGGETGWLAYCQKEGALEPQFALAPQQPACLQCGSARQRGVERLDGPACARWFRREPDIADGRIASHDRRKIDVKGAGY